MSFAIIVQGLFCIPLHAREMREDEQRGASISIYALFGQVFFERLSLLSFLEPAQDSPGRVERIGDTFEILVDRFRSRGLRWREPQDQDQGEGAKEGFLWKYQGGYPGKAMSLALQGG